MKYMPSGAKCWWRGHVAGSPGLHQEVHCTRCGTEMSPSAFVPPPPPPTGLIRQDVEPTIRLR